MFRFNIINCYFPFSFQGFAPKSIGLGGQKNYCTLEGSYFKLNQWLEIQDMSTIKKGTVATRAVPRALLLFGARSFRGGAAGLLLGALAALARGAIVWTTLSRRAWGTRRNGSRSDATASS